MCTGYALEILDSATHTRVHYSEHGAHDAALGMLSDLGYPRETHTPVSFTGQCDYYALCGADHLYVKIIRLNRQPR